MGEPLHILALRVVHEQPVGELLVDASSSVTTNVCGEACRCTNGCRMNLAVPQTTSALIRLLDLSRAAATIVFPPKGFHGRAS